MFTPRLEIYPHRITRNAVSVLSLCARHSIHVACVTRGVCAHPSLIRAYLDAGARMLADSRTENLAEIRKSGYLGPLMLLRLPTPSRAREAVEFADVSLVSSLDSMKALGTAARFIGKHHQGVLMVDVGQQGAGILPEKVIETAKSALGISGFELVGLGCRQAGTGLLVSLAEQCRRETGLPLPLISGGTSHALPQLLSGQVPPGINHFRIGTTIVTGRTTIDHSPWPDTRQDAFIAVGEILEIEKKPSGPDGVRGNRKCAIVNLGKQDAVLSGLIPLSAGISVLEGTPDHLLLDVAACSESLSVGDEICFYPDSAALLALSTSRYVHKIVIEEKS